MNKGHVMKQRGMSLIEVMVAVVILASGLLGLGAMQARSVGMNQSAHYRSIAADLASDLADRIRANRTPYFAMDGTALHADLPRPPNFANCPQNTSTPDAAPTCTYETGHQNYLVSAEMAEWNTALRNQLPDGKYVLTQEQAISSAFYRYRLTIYWAADQRDLSPDTDLASDTNFSKFVTVIE